MTDLLSPKGRRELRKLAASRALLAFDFDGTLAPIVRHADRAAMRPRTRALLAEVASRFPCAVVSGRARADLRHRLAGIPVRWLIGNHGAEGLLEPREARRMRGVVRAWRDDLQARLDPAAGVRIEDKKLSLSVHYRGVPRPAAARRTILAAVSGLPGVRVVEGKRVVNVVLASAPDKGSALTHLVGVARPERVLFVGDDDTDEDAFGRGLGVPVTTVRVGFRGRSRANFFLIGQDAMDRMLEILLAATARQGGGAR